MQLTAKRIRLRVDAEDYGEANILDQLTSKTPQLWRGNDVRFDLGIFYNDSPVDLSNIASLTLEVFAAARTGAALASATIATPAITPTLTVPDWNSMTAQHGVIEFSSDQMNIAMESGQTSRSLWLCLSALTTASPGKSLTLGAGTFTLIEDGHGNSGAYTPPATTLYYNRDESDARYMQIHGDGSRFRQVTRNGVLEFQFYFPDGKWRTLLPIIQDGQPTHAWGPAED